MLSVWYTFCVWKLWVPLCADLQNVCTEAGIFAIWDICDFVVQEDFMKAVRKMDDAKKLETTILYDSSFGEGNGWLISAQSAEINQLS